MVSEFRNQDVACEQNTNGTAEAIRKVKHRERDFGTALSHKPSRNERERHTNRNCNRERRTCRQHHLQNFRAARAQLRHKIRIVKVIRNPNVHRVVNQPANANRKLHRRIPEQRSLHALHKLTRDKTTNRKPAHVNAERKHLTIARMSEEKFKVPGPRPLVNETRKTRESKKRVNNDIHECKSILIK